MKIIIFNSILLLLLLSSCNKVYKSLYQNPPLKIDGSSSDWFTTLDKKSSSDIYYSITNDNENLYFRLNTSNQSIQHKIHMNGLTVWIDTTGNKNKELGLKCPVKKSFNNINNNHKQLNQTSFKWSKDQILDAEFIGFNNTDEYYCVSKNPYGVEISIKQDDFKSLYYEIKVPFSSINVNYSELCLRTFSIGFEIEKIERPPSANMSERSGKVGGRQGGRMGGSRPSGNPKSMPDQSTFQELNTTTNIWVKNIQLSKL